MNDAIGEVRLADHVEWRIGFPCLVLIICAVGILSIYSVTLHYPHGHGGTPLSLKQAMWVCFGALAFIIVSSYDYHKISRLAYPVYIGCLFLLLLVLVAGRSSHGAQRWLDIGGFSFQPSEAAKVALILMLARYFSSRARSGVATRLFLPTLLMLPGLLLILLQPDFGTGVAYLFIFFTILLLVGARTKDLIIVCFGVLTLVPFLWKGVWTPLRDYQQGRILAFLDPTLDPLGKGYQALQSKIAIGSGRLTGQGLSGATQSQLQFLPEGYTDFTFAVFAEQWGFLGVLFLFSLFLTLFMMGVAAAERARDTLGTVIVVGVIAMVGFGFVVNIGMTIGLLPIVGIPLPLVSYGGTTTIMTMAGLGLLLNVKQRKRLFA